MSNEEQLYEFEVRRILPEQAEIETNDGEVEYADAVKIKIFDARGRKSHKLAIHREAFKSLSDAEFEEKVVRHATGQLKIEVISLDPLEDDDREPEE